MKFGGKQSRYFQERMGQSGTGLSKPLEFGSTADPFIRWGRDSRKSDAHLSWNHPASAAGFDSPSTLDTGCSARIRDSSSGFNGLTR